MNPSPTRNSQLYDLLDRVAEGESFATIRESLNTLLRDDAELQRVYLEYQALHAALVWDGVDRSAPALNLPTLDAIGADATALPSTAEITPPRTAWWLSPAAMALAASLLVVGYFVSLGSLLVWDRIHPRETQTAAVANTAQAADVSLAASSSEHTPVARLIHTHDCTWATPLPADVKTGLAAGHELRLTAGVVELQFADGANVLLQGPAQFSLEAGNRGYLHRGQLLAHVERRASGFTVQTDHATIIDRGTEFGVSISDDKNCEVEVFEGVVDVNSVQPQAVADKQSMRLKAGAARRITADGKITVLGDNRRSGSQTTSGLAQLRRVRQQSVAPSDYASAVLADKPIGYWRFADLGENVAVDASGHQLNGAYHGTIARDNPGITADPNDRSLHLLGKQFEGSIRFADLMLPPTFSVELWVRSATPNWNTFGWILSDGLLIHPEKDTRGITFHVPDKFGYRIGVGYVTPPAIDDRFHHYVFTFNSDANRVAIFVDGKLEFEKYGTDASQVRREPKQINLELGRQQEFGPERCGEGWIDELAIYPQSLTAESVRRHYEAAKIETKTP